MRRWIGSADSAGLQIAVHAIGDRANAILLSIYDSVARAHGPRDRRFRVEHAQHLRPQDIPLFGKLGVRSEEHTSELQSRLHLVCRLLLEKKKKEARSVDWKR